LDYSPQFQRKGWQCFYGSDVIDFYLMIYALRILDFPYSYIRWFIYDKTTYKSGRDEVKARINKYVSLLQAFLDILTRKEEEEKCQTGQQIVQESTNKTPNITENSL